MISVHRAAFHKSVIYGKKKYIYTLSYAKVWKPELLSKAWLICIFFTVIPCQSFVKQYKSDSNESFEKAVSICLGRVHIQIQNLLPPNLLRCWEKETNIIQAFHLMSRQNVQDTMWMSNTLYFSHTPLLRVACCHSMRAMSEVHACLMSAVAAWRM